MCDNEPRKPSSRKPAAQCAYAAEVIHLKSITGSEIFPLLRFRPNRVV
jgi:hypothetical protein